jgi:hypothetical protein
MPIQRLHAGAKFDIYAWGDKYHCETLEFLEQLEGDSNSDANRLLYLIKRTAELGAPYNDTNRARWVTAFSSSKLQTLLAFFGSMMLIA